MAVENDNSSSMSDKDREMTRKFGGETRAEDVEIKDTDDDSEEEKDSKKNDKKSTDKRPPLRSLFIRGDQEESSPKHEQTKVEKPKNLFAGILKEEVAAEPAGTIENAKSEETEDAFQEVVLDRLAQVEEEIETATQDTASELLADASYLEDVGERIEEGLPPEEAIDDAFEDQLMPPEADAELVDLENATNFEEDEVVDVTHTTRSNRPTNTPPLTNPPSPVTPNIIPPTVPPIQRGRAHGGAGVPPSTPAGPNVLNSPNIPPLHPNNLANNPNLDAMNEFYYRKKKSRDLLVGGIVGYMIGRRGGRKRTEARLEPEIRKRDETIGDLKDKLLTTEDRVRELARERSTETALSETVGVRTEKTIESKKETAVEERKMPVQELVEIPTVETVVERIEHLKTDTIEIEKRAMEDAEKAFETTLEDKAVEVVTAEPELVEQVLERSPVVEQIVAAKVASEVEKQSSIDKKKEVETQKPASFEIRKDPRTMTVPELLDIADHIHLEKTSLKELYEHGRIDAVNMRRVVLEYLNGGNRFEKVLRGSLEAVEMQRELRHEMKQDRSSFSQSGGTGNDASNQPTKTSNDAQTVKRDDVEPNALLDASQKAVAQEQDERLMVSNSTAIVLGIVTGIAIMIMLLLYSNIV